MASAFRFIQKDASVEYAKDLYANLTDFSETLLIDTANLAEESQDINPVEDFVEEEHTNIAFQETLFS